MRPFTQKGVLSGSVCDVDHVRPDPVVPGGGPRQGRGGLKTNIYYLWTPEHALFLEVSTVVQG